MQAANFVATINKYGANNLIAIIMDNSSRKVFPKLDFDINVHYAADITSITIIEHDVMNNEYLSVKHVENIQGLIFATAKTDKTGIDTRLMSS